MDGFERCRMAAPGHKPKSGWVPAHVRYQGQSGRMWPPRDRSAHDPKRTISTVKFMADAFQKVLGSGSSALLS